MDLLYYYTLCSRILPKNGSCNNTHIDLSRPNLHESIHEYLRLVFRKVSTNLVVIRAAVQNVLNLAEVRCFSAGGMFSGVYFFDSTMIFGFYCTVGSVRSYPLQTFLHWRIMCAC